MTALNNYLSEGVGSQGFHVLPAPSEKELGFRKSVREISMAGIPREPWNDEDEFHSCDDDESDNLSDVNDTARPAIHTNMDKITSVSSNGFNNATDSACADVVSMEGTSVDNIRDLDSPEPQGFKPASKTQDISEQSFTGMAGLTSDMPVAKEEPYTYAGVVGGLVAAGLDAASAVGFGSCLDELGRGRGRIGRIYKERFSLSSENFGHHTVESDGTCVDQYPMNKACESTSGVEETTFYPTVNVSSIQGMKESEKSDAGIASCESSDISISNGLSINSDKSYTNPITFSTLSSLRLSSVISTSASASPTPNSPCESPGVFFSCYTSLSDLRDDSSSPKPSFQKVHPGEPQGVYRSRNPRKKIPRQSVISDHHDSPFSSQTMGNTECPAASSCLRSKRNNQSCHVKQSRSGFSTSSVENGKRKTSFISVTNKTVGNLSRAGAFDTDNSTNKTSLTPLSQRRAGNRPLKPLALVHEPPARRAKSASPIPSRIPRPVWREKIIRKAPSGSNLSSQRPRATVFSGSNDDSESISCFRKWSKSTSPLKESAQSDFQGRLKFSSGKGGTSWTIPASIDLPTRNKERGVETCPSLYARSTVASVLKRRPRVYNTPLTQSKKVAGSGSLSYCSFHSHTRGGDVCFPTPPSSCPPLSPVSLPSVGSSPVVLIDQHRQQNSFFPCCSTAPEPTGNNVSSNARESYADINSHGKVVYDDPFVNNSKSHTNVRNSIGFHQLPTPTQNGETVIPNLVKFAQKDLPSSKGCLCEPHNLCIAKDAFNESTQPVCHPANLNSFTPVLHYSLDSFAPGFQSYSLDSLLTSVQPYSQDSSMAGVQSYSLDSYTASVQPYSLDSTIAGVQPYSLDSSTTSVQPYSLDSSISGVQPYSLDSSMIYAQPYSMDSSKIAIQPYSLDFQMNPHVYQSPNIANLYLSTDPGQPQSLGDSNYGSLPLTMDSITSDYQAFPSLPLSHVSSGKDELELSHSVFAQGYDSKSEDSLEDEAHFAKKSVEISLSSQFSGPEQHLGKDDIILRNDQVDWEKAKLKASLAWLLSKVYGANVPKEMQDPFYETSQGQLALRPVLVNLMSSSELYCQACANMFPETHAQWSGHWSIIQVLSRKGIYVSDTKESAVTETVLVQTAPFRLKAHLALIDALMKAYLCEVASVEKVAKAVRNFTTFPASSELPGSPEEALKFWINKVCAVISREGVGACHKARQLLQGDAGQKVIVTTNNTGGSLKEPVNVPLLEDIMRDIGDGCSVAALIAYYRPQLLDIKSICLKESIGIADSLYNLRLIGQFCRRHLPWGRFHLTYEDLLYTHPSMHINISTFLADLFFCFEGPGSSQANSAANAIMTAKEKLDAMPAAGKRSAPSTPASVVATATAAAVSSVPISNATKKSFQRRPSVEDTAGNLGMTAKTGAGGMPSIQHHPLLPRRSGGRRSFAHDDGSGVGGLLSSSSPASPPTAARRGRRTVSLCSPQDRETVQRSVLAWQDDQRVGSGQDGLERRSGEGSAPSRTQLLANVSMDSNLDRSLNTEASISLDLDSLKTPRLERRSGEVSASSRTQLLANVSMDSNLDRSLNTEASISLDLDDLKTPRTGRDSALDPSHPDYMEMESVTSGQPSRFASPHSSSQPTGRTTAGREDKDGGEGVDKGHIEPLMPAVLKPTKERDVLLSKAQERGDKTPRKKKISSPTEPSPHRQQPQTQHHQQPQPLQQHQYQPQSQMTASGDDLAVTLSASSSETTVSPLPGEEGQPRVTSQLYPNHYQSPESIDSTEELPNSARSNGGSHTDSGSSFPPGSDINNKPAMVINDQINSNYNNNSTTTATKALPLSNTTNFAELKRLKDNMELNIDKVDNSGLIYMQSGSHHSPHNKTQGGADLKSTLLNSQGQGKTTTFGQLSPMQEVSQARMLNNGSHSPITSAESNGSVMSTSDPGSSELQQLRLKLEQKRKEIERKKLRQEAQQNKMRQRLGKAAFMRVVSKHMEEGEEGEEDSPGKELPPTLSTHAQLQARLGYNSQRLPLSRPQPAVGQGHMLMAGAGNHQGSGSVPPPEASAQRFTDWRSQTTGRAGSSGAQSGRSSQSPEVGTGASNATTHAFSRAGIQQTIDNVKNKWFSGGANDSANLLVAPGLDTGDHADGGDQAEDSFRLHDGDLLADRASHRSSLSRLSASPPAVEHSSPYSSVPPPLSQHQRAGSAPREVPSPAPPPHPRRASDSMDESQDARYQQYQEYDSSLDKLNSSLSDLQGEIMRLSLKSNGGPAAGDPRLSAALSAIGSTSSGTVSHPPTSLHQPLPQQNAQTRPIHGIPVQAPYIQAGRQQQQQQQQDQQTTSVPYNQHQQQQQLLRGGSISGSGMAGIVDGPERMVQPQHSIPVPPGREQKQHHLHQNQDIDSGSKEASQNKDGGFFVSFGDNSSPKRAKPKLSEHRSATPSARGVSPAPSSVPAGRPQQHPQQQQQSLWVPGTDLTPSPDLDPAVAAVVAGQAVAPLTPASKADLSSEDKGGSSPSVGFVIQDQASLTTDHTLCEAPSWSKMFWGKINHGKIGFRLKRKEDQERKKLEKEAELARKQEEKMVKEEEQERRKAEERARRDQIFQQYMQKKAEEDNVDGTASSQSQAAARAKVKRRDRSASNSAAANKQRPKSMFVKAATPEPGSLGGHDSCSSSQEDLARAGAGGRNTPGVMSAMRSAYHFRLPQQNRMRKAVSCNTLQGPSHSPQGQATFRRPPSPDLFKIKQQRQRGNSQDSGSDNGSNPGSNPGSDFSGPKLYVKPSAKSNRHIIVNAISHCCLAGSVNTDMKNKVLEEMSKCDANHFLILFRDAGCQYRGLFILYPDTEEAVKVCGVGPRHITNKMCEKFYKYNSGGKSFTEIVSKKHLSVSVDAVVLLNSLWKSGKAAVKR
ncbi:calmodulin-regulated spectrin-associated protein 1 [Plakobranchus ocellatus]|uniref:Calmodulin-regulated spectrin-associated protein 1 n=1 Tax=Plakobranchus ocellatus TaxID=259542 RepID=A0AAV4DBD6_9GAST|nr:calmodulin-regulated spectrin-associated protein 1 [Plakobranchus ocellatus]